jgi:hypothetical protein
MYPERYIFQWMKICHLIKAEKCDEHSEFHVVEHWTEALQATPVKR